MLTDTDIHYVVGMLCQVFSPDEVDIVLGDRIYNEASRTKRDVDVVIKYKDLQGQDCALAGIEVKAHRAPLDVTHIEQLAAKLRTHPELTKYGIVSASSYTKGAITAASHYGVALYRLEDWDIEKHVFRPVEFHPSMFAEQHTFSWVGTPSVVYIPERHTSEEERAALKLNSTVSDRNGEPIPHLNNLNDVTNGLLGNVLNTARSSAQFKSIPLDFPTEVVFDTRISDEPCIQLGESLVPLTTARITGLVEHRAKKLEVQFKVLVADSTNEPMVACAISEFEDGTLFALTVSQKDLTVYGAMVPVSERLKKKIFKHRLGKIDRNRTR